MTTEVAAPSAFMRRIVTALAVAIVLAVPVSASAATVDQNSDHTALSAYSNYLGSIVKRVKFGKADEAVLTKSISGTCPGRLLPALQNAAPTMRSKAALNAVGEEIGGDVAVKFLDEAHLPFKTLARKLDGLHWSSSATRATVHSFVAALHAVLTISPSHLCHDVVNLATKFGTEPAGTKSFVKNYLSASSNLQTKLAALVKLLERYETTADAKIVTSINNSANKFNKVSSSDEKASRTKLVAILKQR